MKRFTFILTLCIVVGLAAQAQQATQPVNFKTYSVTANKQLVDASKAKDYKRTVEVINEWLQNYAQQTEEVKKGYVGYLPNMYYNLACYNALEGKKDAAIAAFEQAVNTGYVNYKHATTDSDLDPLRNNKTFKAAMTRLREKGDYGYILQNSGAYKSNKKASLPSFTYQSASAPQLVAFRQQFNLDSVSGTGDEISKMKNLLYWVHNVVKHDGNSNNPKIKNGIDLIKVCKAENRGVNCRMMATILKDAYQAEGFKSRVVTCMPKDTADFDCHVITVVWSNTLNKWVWMDPTFNAYVSDDKGNLQSIQEVREKLIAGSTLVLNEDANWNNQSKQTKAQYLDYYMSKNLYWLQCAVKSEWDLETRKPGMANIEYINLYPGNYSTIKGEPKKTSGDMTTYATNDPEYFWQKPTTAL